IGQVWSVAFSPDGQYLASGGDNVPGDPSGFVKLWRVADGALIRDFTAPATMGAYAIAYAPDGQTIAAGSQAIGDVFIWRVSDGALLRTLSGHSFSVFSVAYSPDSQTLA